MTIITFNGFSLQSSTVITKDISHEDFGGKNLNIQNFAVASGGRIVNTSFDVKSIVLNGIIKGTSKSDLETNIDTFKKQLNADESDLDIEYESGTRRYIATCSDIKFERQFYTIDVISWKAEFTITNPPFGKNIDTSTLDDLANSASNAATITGEYTGNPDFSGSVVPEPIIQITTNAAIGVRKISLQNVNGDGDTSYIEIPFQFSAGDVLEIDMEAGTVKVNGSEVEFFYGFPKFTLINNNYTLSVVGKSYNVDLKFIYYPLWL